MNQSFIKFYVLMQSMGMHIEKLSYFHDETKCIGQIAYDETIEAKRPAVIIAHAWRGQDDFARQKAIELARLGYIGFAADIYGGAQSTTSDEEAVEFMMPFFLDHKLLQERIGAAFHFLKSHPQVNPQKIGAIGFCFGGRVVYELLRSGIDVRAVVSFHGVFANEFKGRRAKTLPISPDTKGSVLILHGHDDPFVSDEDLKNVQKELTNANIDWQIHIYGNTVHAFTNPEANKPEAGTLYNERAAMRSWEAMQNFFDEVFSD